MTVVFDAGQNSGDNFADLATTGLDYVGSVPASDCPDLTALPATACRIVDERRFGGLTARDTSREVYGAGRRAILTHSPELHASQARGFDGTTLAKAGQKLDELAATLASGKARRGRDKVEAEIESITRKPRVRRVITWQLSGDQPKDLRLAWGNRPRRPRRPGRGTVRQARADHQPRRLARARGDRRLPVPVPGRVLLPPAQRPQVVSFSPMFHWTEHNIRVHVFTCVLALQVAHLMRRRARQGGLDLSVRELLTSSPGSARPC